MSGDLHTRLRTAIEAEKALAEAATAGPWDTSGPDTIAEWGIYSPSRGWLVASAAVNDYPDSPSPKLRGGITGDEANRNAAFIAANDPARVLRRVARDLAALVRHKPTLDTVEWWDDTTGRGEALVCPTCRNEPNEWDMPAGSYGVKPEGWVSGYALAPCPELTDLADDVLGPGWETT